MNAITTASAASAPTSTIVAIDLGKYKSVVCILHSGKLGRMSLCHLRHITS